MSEMRYDVVFDKKIASGQELDEVKQRLAKLYKTDISTIERQFFAKDKKVLKNGVDEATAKKIKSIFERTGAICSITACNQSNTQTPIEKSNNQQSVETPSSEMQYKVIFSGKIQEGQDIQTVKGKIAALYKVPISKCDHMFTGRPVTIKENVNHQTAKKYIETFARMGAICEIISSTDSSVDERGITKDADSISETNQAAEISEKPEDSKANRQKKNFSKLAFTITIAVVFCGVVGLLGYIFLFQNSIDDPYKNLYGTAIHFAALTEDESNKVQALTDIAVKLAEDERKSQADEIFARALEVANSMENLWGKSQADAFVTIATGFMKANRIEKADEIFEKAIESASSINEPTVKLSVFIDKANYLISQNRITEAVDALEQALKVIVYSEDADSKAKLYDIVKGFADLGDFEKALQVSETIVDAPNKVSALAYITKVLSTVGENEQADEILLQALQAIEPIKYTDGKILALLSIADKITETPLKEKGEGLYAVALSLANDTGNKKYLQRIAEGVARLGETDVAIAIAGDDSLLPKDKAGIYFAIAKELAKLGDEKQSENFSRLALKYYALVEVAGIRALAISLVSRELIRSGNIEQAFSALDYISDEQFRTSPIVLDGIIVELSKQGEFERIWDTIKTIEKWSKDGQVVTFSQISYNALSLDLDTTKQKELAKRLMIEFEDLQ